MSSVDANTESRIETNRAIVCRFFEQVWGAGNLAVADELASQDFVAFYTYTPEPISGDAFKGLVTDLHIAFPGLQLTIEETIAEADKVMIRWSAQGVQGGEMKSLNLPATQKHAHWTGMVIYRVADGKVVEERGEDDLYGLLTQLGAIALVTPGK
jgi:predicted ester cyclase